MKDKLELEDDISLAEQRIIQLEQQLTGVQEPHPLDNVKVLEDLENEFKNSERYSEAQLQKLQRKPF